MSAQVLEYFQKEHGEDADGDKVLSEARTYIKRFCVLPSEECYDVAALWAGHTYFTDHLYASPRLAALSAEPESGKTMLLEILSSISCDSMSALNASVATVFRSLAIRHRTLFFDEADTVWKRGGKDDSREELRALLNAGYKGSATIPRCIPPKFEIQEFPVFAPVYLCGVGDCLPETVLSRSIIFQMKRKTTAQKTDSYRPRLEEERVRAIRGRFERWAKIVGPAVGAAIPDLPDNVNDRQREIWEPLVALSDYAGGEWPAKAREACRAFSSVSRERKGSLGLRLLADLRIIFRDAIALHSQTIIERLRSGDGLEEDAPWNNLRGEPIGTWKLATILKKYEVHPQKVTVGGSSLQGYRREDLNDAWEVWLSQSPVKPESPESKVPAIPPLQDREREDDPDWLRREMQ